MMGSESECSEDDRAVGGNKLHVNRPPARKTQRKWDTLLCLVLCHCCAIVVPLLCLVVPVLRLCCARTDHASEARILLVKYMYLYMILCIHVKLKIIRIFHA